MEKKRFLKNLLVIFPGLNALNIVGFSRPKEIASELTGFNTVNFRSMLFAAIFGAVIYYIMMIAYVYYYRDENQNYKKDIKEIIIICIVTIIVYVYLTNTAI